MTRFSTLFAIFIFSLAGWQFVPMSNSGNPKTIKNKGPRPEIISIEAAGDTIMKFTVKTITYGGQFSPKHVLAIWITNSSNTFVRSLKVMASNYKSKLYTWNSQSGGNVTSAITGASLTSHQTHTVVWNGKNSSGSLVADGSYKVWVEYNETDFSGNPSTSVAFTKSSTYQHLTPASTSYFTSQDLIVYGSTGVGSIQNNEESSVIISPNPVSDKAAIEVNIDKSSYLDVKIYSADGKVVHAFQNNNYSEGKHVFFWYPKDSGEGHSGLYFVKVCINKSEKTYKLIVRY
jgi:flagellar hook assembly protein FlgD